MGNGLWDIDPRIELTVYNREVVWAISAAASKVAGRRAVHYIRQELTRADRMDTGTLADSFGSRAVASPWGPQFEIYSNLPPTEPGGRSVADIVNNGTGIYGPYGNPIVSPYGNVMRFNPSRKSTGIGRRGVRNSPKTGRFQSAYVYTTTVQGQQGVHFIEKATHRLSLVDFLL